MTATAALLTQPQPALFDLNDAFRELYERTHIADPGEFADALLESIPPEHLREAARVTLREWVRVRFTQNRSHTLRPVEAEEAVGNGAHEEESDVGLPSGRPNQRYAGLVDTLLRERVSLNGNAWQEFGACTTTDLEFLISARRENAARSMAKAKFYERVKGEVEKHGASRVADLPRNVLRSLATRGDDK